MEVLFSNAANHLAHFRFRDAGIPQGGIQQTKMGDFQNAVPAGAGQAFGSQLQDFVEAVFVDVADGLQTHLGNFPEGAAAPGDPVDIFVIVQLPDTGSILGVLHNGEGYIGLQRHQLAVQIREGNDGFADEKILVPGVEVVLLEFVHFVAGIAIAVVQRPQGEGNGFVGKQRAVRHG